MIKRSDLLLNYLTCLLISILGILPFDFHLDTGQLTATSYHKNQEGVKRRLRSFVWKFLFANAIFYSSYMLARLVQSTVFGQYVKIHHLCWHIVLALFFYVMNVWVMNLFVRFPAVTEKLFNSTNLQDPENKVKRKKYSLQEWLILNLPGSIFTFCPCCFIGIYIHDKDSLQFLFSIVPAEYQNETTFTLLLSYEAGIFIYYMCVVYFGIFIQLAFIQNCNDQLKADTELLESKTFYITLDTMAKMCRKGRQLEIKVELFNIVFAYMIFFYKLQLIASCTVLWYFGIRLLSRPILAGILFYQAVYLTALFVIIYDKAFSVPELMAKYKRQILWRASKGLRIKSERDEIVRIIRSIPNLGIKVGSFQTLEPTSTPIFVDFITKQVCSLLITFP